ncbi:PIN domain-containing protein [Luteibacter pinisoli]|uniref:Ribonuclease VapC n=1 Tax=Luteibacter pinisoli TaxID=2589080 RepID=A0A4Y5Z1E8_9GAMM|nr:PIN domain-containing protein [Luteibacter pinisoli]QDE38253.1 PIN domain-containing protein [Luteibacter pinisoli]
MEERALLDSGVILQLLSSDRAKRDRVEALLARRPFVSVQTLNEVANICRNRARMSWEDIDAFLAGVRHFCPIAGLTEHMHDTARRLAGRYQLSIYDATIIATAIDAGATLVWSEDMHHGLVVEHSVSVINPFRD